MAEITARVDRLEDAIWRGNGKPALVTRMEVCERGLESIDERTRRWEKIAWLMAKTTIGAILALAGHMAWELIAPHLH